MDNSTTPAAGAAGALIPAPAGRLAVLPYAATIFLSSFLLFLVQPIIAKQILPWFGGSAAVWTTCLVFFQAVLLAGYGYADLTTRLGLRRQALLHVGLLVVSLACVPILAASGWKPQGDEEPVGRILLLLLVTIGLPYFLLSTTTPLLQAWYWQRFRTAVPYRLFALSNFASLLALIGFPVLFEPYFTLPQLGWGWSGLYAVLILLCGATAWRSMRAIVALPAAGEGNAPAAAPLTGAVQLAWMGLAALASVMLLAVSNHVTQNISSVPFLWVLPLALYLLTFILAFDHPRWYLRTPLLVLLGVLTPWMAWEISSLRLVVAVPLYFTGLFVACMVCHGELARLKPDPAHLTRFYLMISVGGAVGAVLVAIAAPLLLPGYFELGIALVLLALLLPYRLAGLARVAGFAVAALTLGLVVRGAMDYTTDMRVMERDFYGVVRTRDRPEPVPYRAMYHGAIMHGGQLLGESYRNTPADYFGPTSGYGRVFATLRELEPSRTRDIGVIGLGAGVIASYGRPGDTLVFYEISPRVVDIAKREFTFLKDTAAKTSLVMGDGRLSLEREAPKGYDVLGIDAFSGDSIPMHLITREAMALYAKHIKPDGVIVFQATNRYVDLPPVIKRLAAELGFEAVLVSDYPEEDQNGAGYWRSSTDQVLVTRNKALLASSHLKEAATPIEDRKDLPTFTDAHHNLLRILK
ncbi:MAG: spermidine synthase [Burkholderiales bacterium]